MSQELNLLRDAIKRLLKAHRTTTQAPPKTITDAEAQIAEIQAAVRDAEALLARTHQPEAAQAVEFFAHSSEMGFETFDSQDKAAECAQELINQCRADAIRDDEWPDEVESICWGRVVQKARATPVPDDERESVDYDLKPAPQTAPAYSLCFHLSTMLGCPPSDDDVVAAVESLLPQQPAQVVPEGLQWFTVAEHGLPEIGAEVVAGLWYTDPWLIPEKATRFLWGLCRVLADDHRDFPDGKRWHTFGPSHNEITHWARINYPATASQHGDRAAIDLARGAGEV